jgi:hypothetical protein
VDRQDDASVVEEVPALADDACGVQAGGERLQPVVCERPCDPYHAYSHDALPSLTSARPRRDPFLLG